MRLEKEKEKSLSHGKEEENRPGTRPWSLLLLRGVRVIEEAPSLKCFAASRPISGEASSWTVDGHRLTLSYMAFPRSAGGERVHKFSGFS